MAEEHETYGEKAWFSRNATIARIAEGLDRIESACGVTDLNHRDVLEEAARLTAAEARRTIILLDRAAAAGAFTDVGRREPPR